jgi:hypothetical protein
VVLPTITSPDEVEAGILALNADLDNYGALPPRAAADLKQAFPRARSWVGIQQKGRWLVGFSKFVGHLQPNGAPLTATIYAAERRDISGTDSERAIKRLPGTAYPVGWMSKSSPGRPQHPAAKAVEALCRRFGKQPNSLAEVYVLRGQQIAEEEREKLGIILAAVEAANLSPEALDDLIERVEAL